MEVESRLKPDPAACVCGCGVIAQPRAKEWRDGLGPHARSCQCVRCKGGRTRSRSRRQEHRTARETGGTREPLSGALSGIDGRAGLHVWEETAEVQVCRGLRRWWTGKGTQRKLRRLLARRGEYRAFIAKDEKPWLVVMPFEDWAALVRDTRDDV
jgi:hypothetical protein